MEMTKNRILLLGDIHGEWQVIKSHCKMYDIKDTYIIQVGDFGIGFDKPSNEENKLGELNKFLRLNNNELLIIRGNHDDPAPFRNNLKLSNIEFLPDYTVRNLCGKNFLFVGGAISIDRLYRIQKNAGWWEDEVFVLDEEKLLPLRDIEVVVTHSNPDFATPIGTGGKGGIVEHYAQHDSKLIMELIEERNKVSKMYDILTMNNDIQSWWYGHYHFSNTEVFRGTTFTLLGIGEFKEFNLDLL